MDIKVKSLQAFIVQLFLLLISLIYLNGDRTFFQLSLYGTVITIILWLIIVMISRGFFSNVSFVFLSFILFQFGIPILYATDKSYSNFYLSLFTTDTIIKGTVFSVVCIQAFALGITIYYLLGHNNHRTIFAKTKWANNNALVIKAGLYLFAFCAVIYLPFTIYGAVVLHSRFSLPAIGNIAKQFFFPSALLILCYSDNRKLRVFIYFMYLLECVCSMFTGGRTEGLVPLMVLIVYYFQYRKQVALRHSNLFKNLLLVLGLFIILILLIVIAQIRVGNSITSGELSLKIIYEMFLGELGFNFTTILFVISGVSLIGYQKGMGYLTDIITLIPSSLDPTGLIYRLQQNSGSNWLQSAYGTQLNFGLGFSLIGEAYYNFGVYGVFVIFGFGVLIAYFQAKPADECSDWEKYIQLALLIGLLTVTRRDFYQFLKQIEYSVFAISLYLYIFSKFKLLNKD